MLKWLFHFLIFANSSGKYQNKEKPLKRQKTQTTKTYAKIYG